MVLSRQLAVVLLELFVLGAVEGVGQTAVIVYSRDDSCSGKEVVRAYSGRCIQYFNTFTNLEEYMKFSCSSSNGHVMVESFEDSMCSTRTGNVTEILSNTAGDGSCQKIFGYQNNYMSAQLFCASEDSELESALGEDFLRNKISFRYYTNLHTSCRQYPSIIEMWSEDICLYYESIGYFSHETYIGTGVYGIFAQEVSEIGHGNTGMKPSLVSVRFFNTNDCRPNTNGPIEGEPPPGGIGSPVRTRLRRLQAEDGGDIGGPDGQQKSEIYSADFQIGTCSQSAPAIIHSDLFKSALEPMYSKYAIASIDSALTLDFEEYKESSKSSKLDFEMSTPAILFSWAFLGGMTGLIAYLLYGFFEHLPKSENKNIINDAKKEHEMTSVHSGHGLLESPFKHIGNYAEEEEEEEEDIYDDGDLSDEEN